jgi:hypothetical protein
MVVAISAVEQDVYPPRVLISVTGLTLGDSVELYRVVSSERTPIRAGSSDSVTDPSFVRVDAELPFGVPVTYLAVVNGSTELTDGPDTYVLSGGKPVVTDAITGVAAEIIIVAQPSRTRSPEYSMFKVGGRNVVVRGDRGMYESEIELFVEAGSSADNFTDLLDSATEGVVQIRNSIGTISDYVAILKDEERLYSQDRTDERRLFVLQVAEVEGWADALEAKNYTLLDIANYYGVSGTLADIDSDFTTLLGIAQGDFS